jgi:hypothetical protein
MTNIFTRGIRNDQTFLIFDIRNVSRVKMLLDDRFSVLTKGKVGYWGLRVFIAKLA